MLNYLKFILLTLVTGGLLFSFMFVSTAQWKFNNFIVAVPSPNLGDYEREITVDGRVRTYLLHVPASLSKGKPVPVVIVLHGGGGSAEGIDKITNFTAKADKEKFIVIYPNGTGRFRNRLLTWNSGNCCGYAHENSVDDVSFIRSLIQQVEKEFNIDSQRIFVTGFSNGGMMSYRLACELSDKIAAIAPVAGAFNYEKCNPVRPVSLVVFHGTADEHVLFGGGEPIQRVDRNPRVDRSVAEAIRYWVKKNQCVNSTKKERLGSVIIEGYKGCRDGSGVKLYTLEGHGHTWPGGERQSRWAETPTTEVKATDAMWEFFSSHPKRTF
jgi:polyhydroxybutyrate depolymerase